MIEFLCGLLAAKIVSNPISFHREESDEEKMDEKEYLQRQADKVERRDGGR
jgi:hypothetical protein